MKDVAHEVGIDPADGAVIDIGDLEERIHIRLPGSSLAEDHHAHPPIAFVRLSGLVIVLDDHELTRPHAQEDGVWGIGVMTNAQHQELLELDPDYAAGAQEAQSRLEASLLDKYSKAAEELAAAREAQQKSLAQSSGNAQTGSFNNDFLKRIGGRQGLNMPARRLTGN